MSVHSPEAGAVKEAVQSLGSDDVVMLFTGDDNVKLNSASPALIPLALSFNVKLQ